MVDVDGNTVGERLGCVDVDGCKLSSSVGEVDVEGRKLDCDDGCIESLGCWLGYSDGGKLSDGAKLGRALVLGFSLLPAEGISDGLVEIEGVAVTGLVNNMGTSVPGYTGVGEENV